MTNGDTPQTEAAMPQFVLLNPHMAGIKGFVGIAKSFHDACGIGSDMLSLMTHPDYHHKRSVEIWKRRADYLHGHERHVRIDNIGGLNLWHFDKFADIDGLFRLDLNTMVAVRRGGEFDLTALVGPVTARRVKIACDIKHPTPPFSSIYRVFQYQIGHQSWFDDIDDNIREVQSIVTK